MKQFGGGQLLNWGPHLVDWGMQLIGAPAADVWSNLKCVAARGDAEDHVKILIRGDNEVVADIEISGAAAIAQPEWIVLGSLGMLVIQGGACRIRYVDPKSMTKAKADPGTPPQIASFGGQHPLRWTEESFEVAPKKRPSFWSEVYRALKRGGTFPITLEQARENVRVLESARKRSGFYATK